MSERAQLFDGLNDFDISAFTPKQNKQLALPMEEVRSVSEGTNFKSRAPSSALAGTCSSMSKWPPTTLQSFYEITNWHGWVLGETLERAIAALQKELAAKS